MSIYRGVRPDTPPVGGARPDGNRRTVGAGVVGRVVGGHKSEKHITPDRHPYDDPQRDTRI